MSLTLSIVNVERLENGVPLQLVLERHGAIIGRSLHADWSLPDTRNHISSNHCEVEFRDGGYVLIDTSTNGTFVNGAQARMAQPHPIAEGDEISIGHYRIVASLRDTATTSPPAPAAAAAPAPASVEGWADWTGNPAGSGVAGGGWADTAPSLASTPAAGWGPEPAGVRGAPEDAPNRWNAPGSAISGRGPMSQAWSAPAATSADDIWSKVASSNQVDWARGGFGAEAWTQPQTQPPATPAAPAAPMARSDGAWQAFLAAAGLTGPDLKGPSADAAAAAGGLLRRLVAGLVVMLEARARAKAQLGASGTRLEFDGNNPLKFARTPEAALARLLNPKEQGFMPADMAAEDAFKDLQAHQIATLVAMQSALRTTLDRFSPASIRTRADTGNVLARILPGARDAALWSAYEREFEGVAQGSDEAFMDVFAKAFREAYERAAAD